MKDLISSLQSAGIETVKLGDQLLCTPYGGRVLGLFPDAHHNLLWVPENLYTDSMNLFHKKGWSNVGGDRTWLSPELSFNGDPNLWESYSIQESIDPGDYEIMASSDSSLVMRHDANLLLLSCNSTIDLQIEKEIQLLDLSRSTLPAGVSGAGYKLKTSLKTGSESTVNVQPGIWNIIQIPGGGRIIAPTYEPASPHRFIGDPDVTIRENQIEIAGETDYSFKCGINIEKNWGVMMYRNILAGNRESLVVRTFDTFSANRYSDVPANDPDAIGYVVQFYVDNGFLGGYVELEYHSPYLKKGQKSLTDQSQVLGFVGDPEGIDRVAEMYSSVTMPVLR